MASLVLDKKKKKIGNNNSSESTSEKNNNNVPVSIDEKIAKNIYKELANKKFKKGKYKSAISKYHYVFAYTTGLPGQKAEGEAGQMSSMIKSSNDDVNNITEEQSLACAGMTSYYEFKYLLLLS